MNHHLGARTLPVELLSLVFDDLSLEELLGASHVSTFWRAVAQRHQTFWRDIMLCALSTTALDFFQARLDAGMARTVAIRILIPEILHPERLRSIVLPTLARNLFRVDTLCLKIDVAFDADVFDVLRHSAPRMHTFDVFMVRKTRTSDALPVDLFGAQAPNLRFVRLINVQLIAGRLPPALSTIDTLRYCFDEPQSLPTTLFTHCKRLQTLVITGTHCSLIPDEEKPSRDDSWQLRSVDVSVFSGGFDLMRHIPCSSIPNITIPLNDERSAPVLLAHLRGRLEVHIYKVLSKFHVQYRSLETGMQRTFSFNQSEVADAVLPSIYVCDDLVSRIDAVHASSTCTGLLPAFVELRSCTRIIVTVDTAEPIQLPPRPLVAPALQRLELSSAFRALLSTDNLIMFLDQILDPISRTLQVALTNLTLDGDIAVLGKRFAIC
ncbi:hypothetical protein AURDEDRAFT_163344 [Auricularia subglabra TFB-10046 SS5]|nr:hypothetical protein AURDEDRAFT_163344 [Auricularia subglabra TFB-10046 SS5]